MRGGAKIPSCSLYRLAVEPTSLRHDAKRPTYDMDGVSGRRLSSSSIVRKTRTATGPPLQSLADGRPSRLFQVKCSLYDVRVRGHKTNREHGFRTNFTLLQYRYAREQLVQRSYDVQNCSRFSVELDKSKKKLIVALLLWTRQPQ